MVRALVVDDEKNIVKGIKFSLEQDGMSVDCAYDGEEAIRKAKEVEYDIILLDLMLPVVDGMEVCQTIRGFSQVPIIMLTAKSSDLDKIMGLDNGADDYITKPFNILEVKARIKAIVRRNNNNRNDNKDIIAASDIELDTQSRSVYIAGKEINLTTKEFDILELLVTNPNKVYSRETLLDLIWGFKSGGPADIRTVDVHVRRLREKIEPSPGEPKYVHTKWGVGYYFK